MTRSPMLDRIRDRSLGRADLPASLRFWGELALLIAAAAVFPLVAWVLR